MLDPSGNDEHFSGTESTTDWRNSMRKVAFDDQEEFIGVFVKMPDELAEGLDSFYFLAVQLRDEIRMVVIIDSCPAFRRRSLCPLSLLVPCGAKAVPMCEYYRRSSFLRMTRLSIQIWNVSSTRTHRACSSSVMELHSEPIQGAVIPKTIREDPRLVSGERPNTAGDP